FGDVGESDLACTGRSNRRCGLLSAQLVGGQADDEGDDQRDDAEHHAHHDVEFAVFLIEHVLNSPVDARPDGPGGVAGFYRNEIAAVPDRHFPGYDEILGWFTTWSTKARIRR